MTFYFEFETNDFKMIDVKEIHADSEEEATKLFRIEHPSAKIREIASYHS